MKCPLFKTHFLRIELLIKLPRRTKSHDQQLLFNGSLMNETMYFYDLLNNDQALSSAVTSHFVVTDKRKTKE